jgi:excisionase family DNA binding protein
MAWLTPREAAREMGITLAALYKAVQRRRLTVYRFGRSLRFLRADLKGALTRAAKTRSR